MFVKESIRPHVVLCAYNTQNSHWYGST